MKVAIYSRGLDKEMEASYFLLVEELLKYKTTILLHQPLIHFFSNSTYCESLISFSNSADLSNDIDAMITIGGDGTILDAITLIKDKNIPILGINFGRLGFLANINKDEIELVVESLINRTYVIDKRSLLHVDANPIIFSDAPFGLNEFSIHKRDTAPMIKIHTYLNGEFLNSYWADGLIISTPTGSTGYNMSCNGPILFPDSKSFVITPVAPHNLNVRPIVISDDSIISFEIEGRTDEFMCSMDARRIIVEIGCKIAVRKESFSANLIKLNENSFLSTLRSKLMWGMDKRN